MIPGICPLNLILLLNCLQRGVSLNVYFLIGLFVFLACPSFSSLCSISFT
jgi:hypothetical protein